MKWLVICLKVLLGVGIAAAALAALVLLFLAFYPTVGDVPGKAERAAYGSKTELYHDGRFHNENEYAVMTGQQSARSPDAVPGKTIPTEKLSAPERAAGGELAVTWLGHSTCLVQLGERNILIDPVFSSRTSPLASVGPRRFSEPAMTAEDVPEIDVVFISHDHYDHLDYASVRAIDSRVSHYVMPLGVDAILRGWGVAESKLHPLFWWESLELDGARFTLTPGQHFSGRNPLRSGAALWGGVYMEDGSHSVYYTGDTGYYDVFSRVRERLGAPELMLTETGQYDPAWARTHMFPEQSVRAAADAGAAYMLPVHWGAFCITNHAWYDPPERAVKAAEDLGVRLATPRIGQTLRFDDIDSFTELWWREYM